MASITSPSLGLTFGAAYIGSTMAAINSQMIHWSFDILILDALHVALTTHAFYHYFVDLFGNIITIYDIVWSFKLQILLSSLIIMWVQVLLVVDHNSYKVVSLLVVLAIIVAFGYVICKSYFTL
ncbi:hypothetical protein ARMGADRAFT_1030895 [Armillaria gallica]|uniref:Uncharacterized protein n=1 Tax=Armillaria gallica TaxID=47427 RepID=A0A2H3DP65_ARMGA|nr:hypothetical protein ARMGADRAFT_1030895 [Armillaria gallica]